MTTLESMAAKANLKSGGIFTEAQMKAVQNAMVGYAIASELDSHILNEAWKHFNRIELEKDDTTNTGTGRAT